MRKAADKYCHPIRSGLFAAAVCVSLTAVGGPAFALSELQPATESAGEEAQPADDIGNTGLPLPDPLIDRSRAQAEPIEQPAETTEPTDPQPDDSSQPAEIIRDGSTLPEPVRRMRELIMEAATSGDISKVRPLMNPGPSQTQLNGEGGEDPVETLKSYSGDADGQEILAILLDLLSTGAVRLDAGTADEAYVWPYFAGTALASLTPPQRVELLRIVTAGDLLNMEEAGNYNFYRLGISPDGQWKFFSGGD